MSDAAAAVRLAAAIAPVTPAEAVTLEREELRRFTEAAARLPDDAWSLRSVRSGHDLHGLIAHVAGTYAAQARFAELRRQLNPQLLRLYRMDGDPLPETFVRLQVGDRANRSAAELLTELRADGPVAIDHRARLFRPFEILGRALPSLGGLPAPPLAPFRAVRDLWRHRLDLVETAELTVPLEPDHDGRIVALLARSRAGAAERALGNRCVDLTVGDVDRVRWRFGTADMPDASIELDAFTLSRLLLAWRSPAATRERARIDGDVKSAMTLLTALHGAA